MRKRAIQNQLVEAICFWRSCGFLSFGQVAVDIGLMRVQDFIIANANYDQTAADTSAEGEMHRLLREQKQQIMHPDGSTTDGQSTDGEDTAEEQETGATADTGTAADASTDTQDDEVQRIDGLLFIIETAANESQEGMELVIIKNGEVFQEDGSSDYRICMWRIPRIVVSEDEVTDKTIVDALAGSNPGTAYSQSRVHLDMIFSDADPEDLRLF